MKQSILLSVIKQASALMLAVHRNTKPVGPHDNKIKPFVLEKIRMAGWRYEWRRDYDSTLIYDHVLEPILTNALT